MTPQELKNSILQLAIQGKLVEQRADEGTGAELLEKIFAAKNTKKNLTRSRGVRGGREGDGEFFTRSRGVRGGSEDEGVSNLPKAAKSHHGKHSALSASPREEIPDDEKPFDIPESWEWVRLGEVCAIARGGSPRPIKDFITTAADGVNWIKIGDTEKDGKYICSTAEKIKPSGVPKSRMVHVGDFLLTNSMSFGRPYILKVDGCIHDGWLVISQGEKIFDQEYLYWVLSSGYAYAQFCAKVSGAVVKNLNSDKVANSVFPLPPLAEQKRIVAKIEELLPLVDRYEKAWSRLEDFNKRFPVDMQKSLLQMAIQGKLVEQRADEGTGAELLEKIFAAKSAEGAKSRGRKLTRSRGARGGGEDEGISNLPKAAKSHHGKLSALSASPREEISDDEKPFDIPESWEWYRIGDLFNIVNGFTPLKSNLEFWSNGDIPWFTIEDVRRQGRFIYSTEKFITQKALTKNTERVVPPDTVLLCCTASVGEYAYTKIPLTTNQQFNAFVVKKDYQNYIYPLYVFEYVKTLKNNLIDRAGKTTFNFVSVGKLSKMLIPLPPLAEQKRIVAKLEELLPLCERLKG